MIHHYGEVDCKTTKDVIFESLMKDSTPMHLISNPGQVGSASEDLEDEYSLLLSLNIHHHIRVWIDI